MDTNSNSFNTVTTPEQAIKQFVGEPYIEWLLNYVSHTVKLFPEIQHLKEARPKPERIKKAMLQRFLAAEAFVGGREGDPGFLGFAIANLSESNDPLAEGALEILQKKREEELAGHKISSGRVHTAHRQLWINLLTALGLSEHEIEKAEGKDFTRNYVAELSDLYSSSEWQEAMGAFAAQEKAVFDEYEAWVVMLKANTGLSDKDLEVLTWHNREDVRYLVNTSHVLEKIVFDEENKNLIWGGVNKQLEIRKDFYQQLVKYLES